jgi:predicted MPP superfamily phosphohydrolase
MRRRWWWGGGAALAIAGTLLGVWAFWIEPASLCVVEHPIAGRWPRELDGLRIAVLADLHVGSPYNGVDKLRRIVGETNAVRPDLILLAGDYVIKGVLGGRAVPPDEIASMLRDLVAPLGVFAVLGNHDWWFGARRVADAFHEVGIRTLDDDAIAIDGPHGRFWLVGVSDFWEGPHDVRRALAHVVDDAPVVAFTHNPDVFPHVPDRVALAIAGHTHGGQVCLPILGCPIVPSRYGQRYVAGHIVEDGRHFFVSTGLGTSIIPVRFGVPPEISIVVLRAAD